MGYTLSSQSGNDSLKDWRLVLSRIYRFLWSLSVALAPIATLQAQLPSGSLRGTVRDSSGARVTTAGITISNPERSLSRDAHANPRGEFRLVGDARTIAANLVALEDTYCAYIVEKSGLVGQDEAIERVLSYARLATGAALSPLKAAS